MQTTTFDKVAKSFASIDNVRTSLAQIDRYERVSPDPVESRIQIARDGRGNNIVHLFTGKSSQSDEYVISHESILKAGTLCGISSTMLAKMDESDIPAAFPLINHFFNSKVHGYSMLIDPDRQSVEAFAPRRKVNYSYLELFETALETMGDYTPNVFVDKPFVSLDKGVYFSLVPDNFAQEMKADDIVAGGVTFRDHPLGRFKLDVAAYTYRLVCSNGMISANPVGQQRRASKDDITMSLHQWIDPAIRQCVSQLEQELINMRATIAVKTNGRGAQLMHQALKEFHVGETDRRRMTDEASHAETLYDIVNILTAHANKDEYQGSPERIRVFQGAAGWINTHSRTCEHCMSVLVA